jgi:hypothetical protein
MRILFISSSVTLRPDGYLCRSRRQETASPFAVVSFPRSRAKATLAASGGHGMGTIVLVGIVRRRSTAWKEWWAGMGRDGIEPPTPGFSVPPDTFTRRSHLTSNVVIRVFAHPSSSAQHRLWRIASRRTVQVRGKSNSVEWRSNLAEIDEDAERLDLARQELPPSPGRIEDRKDSTRLHPGY